MTIHERPFGRSLEDFVVGDVYRHWPGKTITEYDDHLFCMITMNHHPLHTNEWFGAQSVQGRNVVVGNLVYSLVLGMSVPDVSGAAIANLEVETLQHKFPTFHGDTIHAETRVLDVKESSSRPDRGVVTVESKGFNQDGQEVCYFRRRVMVWKRDAAPPRARPYDTEGVGLTPRGAGALAGAVAAAVALGVSELVCGLAGSSTSLVTAVGTQFIDRFAAELKDLAVSLFGTNDKVALVVGIVVVSVALGALLGLASVRRPWVGVVGFMGFGIVGLLSYLDDPQAEPVAGVVAAIAAVGAGIATLFTLLRLGRRPAAPSRQTGDRSDRRAFLVGAGSLAVIAAGAAAVGRRLRTSDVVESARSETVLPPPATTVPAETGSFAQVPGLSTYVTPNDDFYRIDTALSVPQVDVASWMLFIEGMVDEPYALTYDELVAMSDVEELVTLSCVSNEVGGNLVGNASWQGVPLATLLDRAGVQPGATQIFGRSVDGFTAGFPTEVGLDGRTALVAVAMNGEPLPAEHGFPARLVIAGLYGYVSATKWLDGIQLATWDDVDGYWIPRGWSKEGPIKTASRIDVPRSGATLDAGPQPIAGVAWAPPGGITRVEVQVDDGGEWREAGLGEAASGNTWVQWLVEWEATSGEHSIRARATDASGATQTREPRPPAPDGATGWHRRNVRVR